MRDISQGEKVEGELDVFISRRHAKRVKEEGERADDEDDDDTPPAA